MGRTGGCMRHPLTRASLLKSLEGRLLAIRKGEFDQQVRGLTPGVSEA